MTTKGKDHRRLEVLGVLLDWDEPETRLVSLCARRLGVDRSDIVSWTLVKRSIDSRRRPRWVCRVEVELRTPLTKLPTEVVPAREARSFWDVAKTPRYPSKVVVVGAGPAGLFCAYALARFGLEPVVIDRGRPVETRAMDVSRLMHRGHLDPQSNICFGEGGAGTWSDGKLYTRVRDPRVRDVLQTIVDLGGPEDILVEGRPHLGTDRLVALCKAFRKRLEGLGCLIRFETQLVGLQTRLTQLGHRISGVELDDGTSVDCDRVVLAAGHSARDIYQYLSRYPNLLTPQPFAVGYRVEHRQAMIDEMRYGEYAQTMTLPTADYRLATNFRDGENKRGVYSFCMCPGGQIVPSPTEPGGVCVNGMSHASRKGHWANSAIVVTVHPSDYAECGAETPWGGPLSGIAFQRAAEERGFDLGGGGFIAPAQRLTDFVSKTPSSSVRKTTYKPGIAEADLDSIYPSFVQDHIAEALRRFDEKMKGFISEDALFIGPETRTSAPVRIERDRETYQARGIEMLYPCGEGSGYGGGIVSSAIDGFRVAQRILEELS